MNLARLASLGPTRCNAPRDGDYGWLQIWLLAIQQTIHGAKSGKRLKPCKEQKILRVGRYAKYFKDQRREINKRWAVRRKPDIGGIASKGASDGGEMGHRRFDAPGRVPALRPGPRTFAGGITGTLKELMDKAAAARDPRMVIQRFTSRGAAPSPPKKRLLSVSAYGPKSYRALLPMVCSKLDIFLNLFWHCTQYA
jgi:hypothetical protein